MREGTALQENGSAHLSSPVGSVPAKKKDAVVHRRTRSSCLQVRRPGPLLPWLNSYPKHTLCLRQGPGRGHGLAEADLGSVFWV